MTVLWTARSRQDITDIHNFIAKDSTSAAARFIDKIIQLVSILETSLRAGRIVPELRQEATRELIQGNYRIVYTIQKDTIYIVTVFERHRLPDIRPISDTEE